MNVFFDSNNVCRRLEALVWNPGTWEPASQPLSKLKSKKKSEASSTQTTLSSDTNAQSAEGSP